MKIAFLLFAHVLTTISKILRPGGVKSLMAEHLLLKHQLLIMKRSRKRSPKLLPSDRLIFGLWAMLVGHGRLLKNSIILRPSTILNFHKLLVSKKYQFLYSPKARNRPGPKGPSQELIAAIVELKSRNPRFGSPRIALIISNVFGMEVDRDLVRRVLAKHYKPNGSGPSWLTFIGHQKDSLWSVDFFKCESILLRSHVVLLVMDQHTRRIIGFGISAFDVDGPSLCRMFHQAVLGMGAPRYLSMDHDPLFNFHRFQAALRILEIQPIQTVPYVPMSHPFIERLIGTIRREYLDHILFWNRHDLRRKLESFMDYYNNERMHASLSTTQGSVTIHETENLSNHRRDSKFLY